MAATVQIIEKTGAGGTPTDKTSGTIRFKNSDNATVDTSNPMVKPVSGTDYSFEKWLRFNVSGGTYTEITNVKAYMDGSNGLGTGVGLWAKAVATFATPAEATATTGYADAFSYTSGSPLTLGAGPFTSTGEKGDHLVMMMAVADTASGGVTSSETLTIAWDEI
jgi:hypothetical protein